MSRIDELIRRHAPGGVEYRTLGDVGTFVRGNGLQKKDLRDVGVPAIHYGQVHTVYGVWASETVSFVTLELAAKLRKAEPGDLVIAATSEDDDAVAKATAWLGDSPAAISGDALIYRHSLDPKFIAYYFRSESFRTLKKAGVTGTKVRRISGDALSRIRVPVPPLEVQREIVETLDMFTELEAGLEAELAAELEARRQAYNQYRDELFSFRGAEGVSWVPMGELGSFVRGNGLQKKDFVEEGCPCIHYGQIYTYYGTSATVTKSFVSSELGARLRKAKAGDLIIATTSENISDVGKAVVWLGCGEVAFGGHISVYSHTLDPLYVAYFFQSETFQQQKLRHVSGTKVKELPSAGMAKIQIPVPAREIQQEVARTLAMTESLEAELEAELRAELEARRQQYEHYRDRLLSFEEAVA